ncbi:MULTISPECIES: DUF1579 domain-containing protein [Microvirga]|uniref:DUF1579 domain-containing protein n=1 Tax=Microvirga TaxID=186650 RepID=UPI0021C8E21D|nr:MULTISPECIES: DUF1579 domain-containing protein [unclassified Microvirga]
MAPQPTPHHNRLHALAGAWMGEEVVADTPWMPGGKARSFVTAKPVLGSFFLEQDYRQERDGQETFRAKGLFTFDLDRNEYRLFWFDNLGFAPADPAGGAWDGNTLSVIRKSSRALARHTITIRSPHEYEQVIENSWDEGASWMPVTTGLYRRRSDDHSPLSHVA